MRRVHQFLLWGMLLVAFFGFFGFSFVSCAHGESWLCWSPCCVRDLGYSGVPPAGHALWAEVGGGITLVTSGERTFKSIKQVFSFLGFMRVYQLGSRIC